MSIKPKLLLSVALLRELHNKIEYYKIVVDNNIKRVEVLSKHTNMNRKGIEKERQNLESLKKKLNSIDLFLETVILKLETLMALNQAISSIVVVKETVKELKKTIGGSIPIMEVYLDRLNRLSNELMNIASIDMKSDPKTSLYANQEAKKIIEEAKKVAGMIQ
ncbi:MAG: hypothetical protein QXT53_01135 [Ignisphaera sp.]